MRDRIRVYFFQIELISPEDLYRACVLFEELNLPVRLRRFESGVLVVQYYIQHAQIYTCYYFDLHAHTLSDSTIAEQMKDLVDKHGPLSSLAVAKYKQVSFTCKLKW